MKKILGAYSAPRPHWVGDGFPVRSLFSYDTLGKHVSPFLLLAYASPAQFAPSTSPRGVAHPQPRGLPTVTPPYTAQVALVRALRAFSALGAALTLPSATAGIEYASIGPPDPSLPERLQNLVRPALGHWW